MNRDRIYGDENLRQQDALLRSKTQEMPDRLGNLVPHSTFQAVWGKHHQFLMQNGVRSKRKKRWGIAACGLVMAIIVAGTAFYTSPEVRAALAKFPFMKMLLKDKDGALPLYGLSQIEEQDLGTKVNQSVTDQNIRFTVDEVYFDGIQIVLNYDVEYLNAKDKINEKDSSVDYKFSIIGAEPGWSSTYKSAILNDHAFIGSMVIVIEADQYLDGYQLQMNISRIGQVKGNWSITVPLSVSKTAPYTKTFFPNKDFVIDGKKGTVERITMTPVTTRVIIRSEDKIEFRRLVFDIRDNLHTSFYGIGGRGGANEMIYNFGPRSLINPYPEYIEIIVQQLGDKLMEVKGNPIKYYEETTSLNNKFPIILKGKQGGTVSITNVEYSEDGTMLYYEASDAENQYPMIVLMDSKEHVNISEPVRIAKDRFAFKMKYPKLDIRSSLKAKVFINEYGPGYKPEPPVWVKIPLDWSKP